jgi:uncharacterized protein YyaL (SSP411 family)
VLGEDADEFIEAYGVKAGGNWEGKNILEVTGTMEQREALAQARARLFAAREARVHPSRDEKVLTSWNGLMLAAFAEAARVLGRDDYQEVAERNAEFLLRELRQENGRLLRTWKAGEAKLSGYLEDYSYLIEGLLELYQTTFEPRWFVAAQELAETMLERFADSEGTHYDTSDDHETLIIRPRDLQDNATPSGNAMAVTALLKLAGFTNDLRYVDIAHQALAQMQPMLAQYPLGLGQWLVALDYALSRPLEITIVGSPDDEVMRALLGAATSGFRPNQVLAYGPAGVAAPAVPLLADWDLVDGKPAAYVCRDFVCQAPVTEVEALRALLFGRAHLHRD